MTVSNPLSYKKTLKQIAVVAREPFSVNGEVYRPPASVKLSPTFWREYKCFLNCGACCPSFSLDYLPEERDCVVDDELREGCIEVTLSVNNSDRVIYSYPNVPASVRHKREFCRFVDTTTSACRIHTSRPFSCRIELIKLRMIKSRGLISKQPYGRGHSMTRVFDGCKGAICEFGKFSEEQFWNNDLPVLEQLKDWADYLGIDSHLERIIYALTRCVRSGNFRTFSIENAPSAD